MSDDGEKLSRKRGQGTLVWESGAISWGWGVVVRESSIEKVIFEQRSEGNEGVSHQVSGIIGF